MMPTSAWGCPGGSTPISKGLRRALPRASPASAFWERLLWLLHWAKPSASPKALVLPWQRAEPCGASEGDTSPESRSGSWWASELILPDWQAGLQTAEVPCALQRAGLSAQLLLRLLPKPLLFCFILTQAVWLPSDLAPERLPESAWPGHPGKFHGRSQGLSSRKTSKPQGWVPDLPQSPLETHSVFGIPQ